ncbi:cell surface hyaluronidase-like [Lingula anatina]|uniref:Cell surface hyaluronidase-like n=1 Tax=Lingula anatina TaxID=7574 RepID=A0A1S3K752_LINAN|nr:cell surface hyaluronidase-like [Lingula anatina]|eukprot:XP_013418458.2 cell surface hyaluronidase-like [Lingula anatina]
MVMLHGILCFLAWSMLTADAICPDKASNLQLWRPGNNPGADVTIPRGKLYLLDRSTTVNSITIQGKLVFKDGVAPIVVKTKHIRVENGGELHIGSTDCRYQGKVTIVLIGKSTDGDEDPDFGKKFIGVTKGGTLEIHGKAKTAWTFLEGHLTGSLAEGAETDTSMRRGLNLRVIDRQTGRVTAKQSFDTHGDSTASQGLIDFINKQKNGAIIAMAAYDEPSSKLNKDARNFLSKMGSKEAGSLRHREPWAFIAVKGSPSETVEERVKYINPTTTHYATAEKTFTNTNGQFRVSVKSGWSAATKWASAAFELGTQADGHVITLADDVSSWREGDRVVISSTDVSMYQTEEFVIGKCESCSRFQIKILGKVNFLHFGGSSYGVDMRAEVGILSRNILIKGEMESKCYGNNRCQFFDHDTFGGHMQILKGFKSVHLSGVELFNMGQQIIGRYPVHFHMCGDVDEHGGYKNPTWVKDLSIHKSFSRCVTIHATHGLLVQNVVGYSTLGHCFFLEDGNEQRNTLDHNLGLLTNPGTILPSERDTKMCTTIRENVIAGYTPSKTDCNAVTTFWIAHPNNTFINNAAGGSAGVGYWFAFHKEPTGASKGTLPLRHGERTPIGKFYNNRAHSNMGKASLMLDEGVKTTPSTSRSPAEYLSMTGARHAPHVDANLNKPRSPSIIDRFTAYKTTGHGIWARGGEIIIQNSRFADVTTGIILASEGVTPFDPGSHQAIRDTIFVGESENRGSKNLKISNRNWAAGFDGKMRMFPSDRTNPKRGVGVYDGPITVERCQFKRFKSQYNKATAAIGFFLLNGWQIATTSRFTDVSFDDVSRRAWFGRIPSGSYSKRADKDGDKVQIFKDEDGSVTGYKDSFVIRADNYLLRHDGCVEKPEWNAAICKGSYAQMWVKAKNKQLRMSMTRTDHPDKPLQLESPKRTSRDPWNQYQPSMLLGQTYTIHWDGTSPASVQLHPINFNKNDNIIVGLCYPAGTTFKIRYQRLNRRTPIKTLTSVNSLTGVKNGNGGVYFWDGQVGLLFLKLTTEYNRDGWNYCSTQGCEYISIEATIPNGATSVCPGQAYPKYQAKPASILIG